MKRIVIRWHTDEVADLIFVTRAVRSLEESGRSYNELQYGDPATKRVTVHRTKAGYAVEIEPMGDAK